MGVRPEGAFLLHRDWSRLTQFVSSEGLGYSSDSGSVVSSSSVSREAFSSIHASMLDLSSCRKTPINGIGRLMTTFFSSSGMPLTSSTA